MKKNLNLRSFLSSLLVIFILMVLTYILTFIIPSGEYARMLDQNLNTIINTEIGYNEVESVFPFYKWLLSPFLVLGAEGSTTIILVIVFLLVIGGITNVMNERNLIKYMIDKTVYKYGNQKYKLIVILVLIFMLLGSFIGSFEEIVPLVPIIVSLMIMLGFDVYTGLGVTLLAVSCGFSSGIMNPFTIGVAQNLAGLPMFSGISLRILSFVLIYALLISFIILHARKVEIKVDTKSISFIKDERQDNALLSFIIILGTGILLIISSVVIKALQDYTMVIVAVMFLVGGTVSSFISGIKVKEFFKSFLSGILGIFPAIIMILMASSIKYTLTEAKILDTIMYYAVNIAENIPRFSVILFIYLLVLVMNFFIASGSAKAFLLIPLIVPIAQIFGISPQLCILAYAFGDGFSNVFYPTNPVLLISLGLTDTSYPKYIKYSWKFQALNLVLTSLILLFGLVIGY